MIQTSKCDLHLVDLVKDAEKTVYDRTSMSSKNLAFETAFGIRPVRLDETRNFIPSR